MTSNNIQRNDSRQSSSRGGYSIQKVSVFVSRAIPSDLMSLDGAVEEVTRAIDDTGFWGDVEGIGLAVREAVANAIIHGNDSDPEKPVGRHPARCDRELRSDHHRQRLGLRIRSESRSEPDAPRQ